MFLIILIRNPWLPDGILGNPRFAYGIPLEKRPVMAKRARHNPPASTRKGSRTDGSTSRALVERMVLPWEMR